jgi:hypothetical protein
MQVGSYAVRDVEEYKNFCDRPKDQRPQPDEVIKVIFFLTCIFLFSLTRCKFVADTIIHSQVFVYGSFVSAARLRFAAAPFSYPFDTFFRYADDTLFSCFMNVGSSVG